MKFYNRSAELEQLRQLSIAAEKKAVLCVITGVRRVGKTELIKQFFKKENGIYLFCDSSKTSAQLLSEFSAVLKYQLGLHERLVMNSWDDLFNDIFQAARNKKVILAIDEFQRFVSIDKSVPFILQKHFDLNKNNSKILILLSGSSFGLLRQMFVGDDAPLFQRASNVMTLHQFDFRTVCKILEDLGIAGIVNKIEMFALFGGIPKYYDMLEDYGIKNADDAMKHLLFSRQAPLRPEVRNIIIEEFGKETATYYAILSAVALGKSKANEIADYASIKETSLHPYIFDLSELLGVLKKELPVTENVKSKRARYYLNNNFFKLWFRFVYKNRNEFELERFDELFRQFQNEKSAFVGHCFEDICKQYMLKVIRCDAIGRWWGAGKNSSVEIDIVALNEKTSTITFAECKWQEKKSTIADLDLLIEKSKFVNWRIGSRTEKFMFFSKAGFDEKTKRYASDNGIQLIDLKELQKVFGL